ncbi:MAG TPA: hypothetical protein VK037_01695 [Pseudogracilibacillus sp.]|nr:hypothetical protein [Pseudogracilibacillus sp.]
MKAVDRYIYAVTIQLPKNERLDVEHELRAVINEKLESYEDDVDKSEAVEEVLLELGHPHLIAKRFRKEERSFLSGILYDYYRLILYTVLLTITTTMVAIFIIETILYPDQIIVQTLQFASLLFIFVLPFAFAWITIFFAFCQWIKHRRKRRIEKKDAWSLESLAPVPPMKKRPKQWTIITAIVIYVTAIVLLTYGKNYFGVWIFEGNQYVGTLSFMNETFYHSTVFFIILFFILNIIKEISKLIAERWTNVLIGIVTLINSASIAILFYFRDHLWNIRFISSLAEYGVVVRGSTKYKTIVLLWDQITFWLITLTMLGLLMGILTAFTKGSTSSDDL